MIILIKINYMKKTKTEILDNIQYQIEHPPNNIKATNSKNNKENSNLKQKKQKIYITNINLNM